MKNNKIKNIIIFLLILFIFCIMTIGIYYISQNHKPNNNSVGVVWEGYKETKTNTTSSYNYVDGFSKLTFESNSLKQSVNFHNDKRNHCYAKITIRMNDNTILWSSDNLYPNNALYYIDLEKHLSKGIYENCIYTVQFYDIETGIEVNPFICYFTLEVV